MDRCRSLRSRGRRRWPAPLVGAVLGDSVRYLLAASVVMALGYALG